jgi:hypothetical protein
MAVTRHQDTGLRILVHPNPYALDKDCRVDSEGECYGVSKKQATQEAAVTAEGQEAHSKRPRHVLLLGACAPPRRHLL